MIKIFNATDRDFSTAGNIIIEPIKCIEYKKKSLNGWYIEVEMPIKYKDYISKDKLCVVKTKSKIKPQAFRIGENIEYTTRKIKFVANHVMFDSKNYLLLDVRPTNQNGLNGLNYINERTDNVSPFSIYSNVENTNTAYFIKKNLLEAWEVFEERWGGVFDADNWDISFLTSVGNDNGETIRYGQDMQGFDIYEDWSSVCTKLCPVGYDGIMLPETYLESDVQYEQPYTRVKDFQTNLESEEQTKENLLAELRENAEAYLEENKIPKVSYTVISNVKQNLEIGDSIKVSHPFVEIFTEVLEYEYNIISEKVISLTFGNYSRDVKTKFDNIKNTINQINQAISKQEVAISNQTNIINTLNKNGLVYIDENEILILDKLPKEQAKNVWRFGLGGLGFSSNGYEGPFDIAMTMDGQINAKFITTGTMSVSRIEGLANTISEHEKSLAEIDITLGQIQSTVEETTEQQEQKINELTLVSSGLNLAISKVGGNNLIRNSAMINDTNFWLAHAKYPYSESNFPPADPAEGEYWYCTATSGEFVENQMYVYRNGEWHTSEMSRKALLSSLNYMAWTTSNEYWADGSNARETTISGRVINLNGKEDYSVSHIFNITEPITLNKNEEYLAISYWVKNSTIQGSVGIGVMFMGDYDLTTEEKPYSVYEPGLLLTPDDLKDRTKIEQTIRVPKKSEFIPVVVSSTAPTDTTKVWLDTTIYLPKAYNTENSEWEIIDTTMTLYNESSRELWTYRMLFGCYYQTPIIWDTLDIKSCYVALTFYPGFAVYTGDTEPTPYKGLYWNNKTSGLVKRAKYNNTGFVEWETLDILSSQLPTGATIGVDNFEYIVPIKGFFEVADLKLEYNRMSTQWSQFPGEVYGKNYKMDEKGFWIQSNQNVMFIDEDEILATYKGTNIFQINKDLAYFYKIQTLESMQIGQYLFAQQKINNEDMLLLY